MKVVNLFGGPGTGKAQPLTAKILTPNGWTTMGDIKVGDVITSPTLGTTTVTHIHPQGLKDIYRIEFHDGSSTEVCLDHLWKCWYVPRTYNKSTKSFERKSIEGVLSTKQILDHMSLPPVGDFKYIVSIPLLNPTDKEPIFLPIHPYLLGCMLGDGSLVGSTPRLTTADPHIIEQCSMSLMNGYVFEKLQTTQYEYSLRQRKPVNRGGKIGFQPNYYTDALKHLGLHKMRSHEKFIPQQYFNGSIKQRIDLLQGLMDTDGTVSKSTNSCSYTTTSYNLAQDVQRLVWSLGGICTITQRTSKDGNNKTCKIAYTLHITVSNAITLFNLPRKSQRTKPVKISNLRRRIVSIKKVGVSEAKCITVNAEDSLYVTDDYIVTHNSTLAAGVFHHMKCKGYEVELVTEYAKDMVYEKRANIMDDQIYIFAKQYRRVSRLRGQVDYVIVDSPILLSCAYTLDSYYKSLEPLVVETFESFNNVNFVLQRPPMDQESYTQENRVQTPDEALQKDQLIHDLLAKYNQPYVDINSRNPNSIELICSYL